jgi:hypothetical protein
MNSKKQVRRNRKDRTVSFWLENGVNLLEKITNSRVIRKRIFANFETLKAANKSKNIPVEKEALAKLNNEKYALEDDWMKWINRSNQKNKDKNRKKIYLDDKISSLISNMAQGHSATKLISHLMNALAPTGINSVVDLYDMQEYLEPFKDALNTITTENLQEKDITPDTSIANIIKKMTDTLVSNKITSYKELLNLATRSKQIEAKLSKISTVEQELTNQVNAINMSDEIIKRDKEIAELIQKNLELKKELYNRKPTKNTTGINKRFRKLTRTNTTSKK